MQEKIETIRARIAAAAAASGRAAEQITLVAVSKTVGTEEVRVAASLGIHDFGENRPQELKYKGEILPQLNWHMIGRLQTNKVKDVVGRAVLIHSLDRWNLAEEMNRRAQNSEVHQDVLLQVNIAGEEQKTGIEPGDVEAFLDAMGQLESLHIRGLMTIAPLVTDPEEARPIFRELYHIQEKVRARGFAHVNLQYLSMGMSQDFQVAIEEGANLVRIGSAIFH
ncbi:MAG TPA: YggS family pyridoxal phosphate-dependent enzyme [Syntrophomonadaceae bacterium]|nr:YggS family pyridoxal phosphate-dependent enzyme [Syntrophomonadaceae bacterium]